MSDKESDEEPFDMTGAAVRARRKARKPPPKPDDRYDDSVEFDLLTRHRRRITMGVEGEQ